MTAIFIKCKKTLAVFVAVIMAFSATNVLSFAREDDNYVNKIESSLYKELKGSDYVGVLVKMKDSKNENYRNYNGLSRTAKGKKLVKDLLANADDSQEDIIPYIEKAIKRGDAKTYESFYIVNSISLVGKPEFIKDIARRSDVEKIVEDSIFRAEKSESVDKSNSFKLNEEKGKHIPWNLKSISVPKAHEENIDGNGVVVGIIDSGVDGKHPAIKDAWRGNEPDKKVYSWFDATAPKGSSQEPIDSTGHGTHVAGTILGKDGNGENIGVAPGAKWIGVKVFDEDGETTLSRLVAAGEWILAPTDEKGIPHAEMAPKIVNSSWGGQSEDEFFRDILIKWRKAGILPIFSAGNVGFANQGGEGSIGTPASYPEAFAVGALRKDDKIAAFSLRGPSKYKGDIKPDISAPGVNIRSSVPGGGYDIKTGTSMASPHVAGAAALILQADSSLKPDDVEEILKDSASPLSDEENVSTPNFAYGHGKLNAYRAVKLAEGEKGTGEGIGTLKGRLMTLGKDENPPAISHNPIKTMFNIFDFDVTASVEDDNGVEYISLYIASKNSTDFNEIKMKLIKGSRKKGLYSTTLTPSMLKDEGMKYYFEAEDTTGKKSKSPVYESNVKEGVSIGYKQDFESDIDGFEFGGKTPIWQWGEPLSGPGEAASGKKLLGTNLAGNYNGLKEATFVTPPIDLTKESKNAALSFKHWYELGDEGFALFDTAEVWIGKIKKGSTSQEDIEYKNVRKYKYREKEWKNEYIDLSSYKGEKIIVMFGLRYAGGWSKRIESGWYVDDIAVEEASKEIPETPKEDVGIRYDAKGMVKFEFTPLKNPKITSYALYRAREKDGEYKKVTEIDRATAGTYTATLSDFPKPQSGTYYYYAKAFIGENGSEPTEIISHTFNKGKEVKKFDFEKGDEGWTTEADDKGNVWERGDATPPDIMPDNKLGSMPSKDQIKGKNEKSPNVWATVLKDFRKPKAKYTLLSPIMDLSKLSKAEIHMQMWYNTRGRKGMDEYFQNFDEDRGEIFVSKDGGSSWISVYKLEDKTIEGKTLYGLSRGVGTWYLDGFKVPEDYLTNNFRMKFVLNSGSEAANTTGYGSGGWYIDDVAVYDTSGTSSITPGDVNMTLIEPLKAFNMGSENHNYLTSPMTPVTRDVKVPLEGSLTFKETGLKVNSEKGSGNFSIKHPVGTYKVIAHSKGYVSKEITVKIEKNKIITEDIVLEKSNNFTLSFNVKSKEGTPLENAVVKLYTEDEPKEMYKAEGNSGKIDNIYSGKYKLVVSAEGYLTEVKDIEFTDSTNDTSLTFKLNKIKLKDISQEEKEKKHDDGSAEAYLSTLKDGRAAGVKFNVSEQSVVKSVKLMFVSADPVSPSTRKLKISIYDANNKDGEPGRLLGGPFIETFKNENGWNEFDMPESIQVKGDFFVAYTQVGDEDKAPNLGIDNSKEGKGNSFKMINGAWNSPEEKGAFMIRAHVIPFTVEKPSEGSTPSPSPQPQPPVPSEPLSGDNKDKTDADKKDESVKIEKIKNRDVVISLKEREEKPSDPGTERITINEDVRKKIASGDYSNIILKIKDAEVIVSKSSFKNMKKHVDKSLVFILEKISYKKLKLPKKLKMKTGRNPMYNLKIYYDNKPVKHLNKGYVTVNVPFKGKKAVKLSIAHIQSAKKINFLAGKYIKKSKYISFKVKTLGKFIAAMKVAKNKK